MHASSFSNRKHQQPNTPSQQSSNAVGVNHISDIAQLIQPDQQANVALNTVAQPTAQNDTSQGVNSIPEVAQLFRQTQATASVAQLLDPFEFTVDFSGSVGAGGTNNAADVASAITRLVELGFLTEANAALERPTPEQLGGEVIPNIPDAELPLTIAAITAFQRTVVGLRNPDGRIDRHGGSHQFLNTATAPPTAEGQQAIDTARSGLGVNTVDGAQELGSGFTGPVGNTSQGNSPADLTNIQSRLVELGRLSGAHAAAEAPEAIIQANPNVYTTQSPNIRAAHIPRTIAAIEAFQNRRATSASYWANHPNNVLGTSSWTPGVVAANDVTFILLRDFSRHNFSFQDPTNDAETVESSFYGPVRSGYTVSSEGTVTYGTADPNLPLTEYTAFGLNNTQGEALRWVENAEGRMDAVNSYDRAIVSFGFIQFAGERSLEQLLALIKNDSPGEFDTHFGQYGIDVEYRIRNGRVQNAVATVIDTESGAVLRGRPALEAIRASPAMTAAFIKAGHYTDVQRAQIQLATQEYALPAVAARFNRNIQGVNTGAQRLSEVMRSEKGLAALISCYINLPGRLSSVFTDAIETEASQNNASTWAAISALSDIELINNVIAHNRTPDTWSHRLNEILGDNTLSASK